LRQYSYSREFNGKILLLRLKELVVYFYMLQRIIRVMLCMFNRIVVVIVMMGYHIMVQQQGEPRDQ